MTTAELTQDPGLAPLLPFVKLWYSAPCVYTWTDDSGMVHQVLCWPLRTRGPLPSSARHSRRLGDEKRAFAAEAPAE